MTQKDEKVTRYLFADLILDVQRGVLFRAEDELALPKLSYELLLALLRASPTLLNQSELLNIVWPNVVIGDETLKQRVKLLRRSLSDSASNPQYIEAVRGRGYRLIPEVSCEVQLAKPAAVLVDLQERDHFPNIDKEHLVNQWQMMSKILSLIVLVLGLIISVFVGVNKDSNNTAPRSALSFNQSRILILPFEHTLGVDQKYILEKVRRSIFHRMANITNIQLVSPTSADSFADTQTDLQIIASKFNAGLLLEGSLKFSKEQVMVQLQLNDIEQQVLLWSEEFISEVSKLAELQLAINQALVSVLNKDKAPLKNKLISSEHKQAYHYYLQGKRYYQRYRTIDNDIAIDFFNKAISLANDFSLAYSGLSQAYSQKVFQFGGDKTTRQKAIDSAYQAITYDNESAESYKALGTAYYVSGWLAKSITPYVKSLALSPEDVSTISNLGFIYSEQGKLNEALAWHKKALSLDKDHVVSMVHAGQTLQRLGYLDLATQWYKQAINKQPDYLLATYHLGQLKILTKEYLQARKIFQTALKTYHQHPLLLEGLADSFLSLGDLEGARKIYQKLNSEQHRMKRINNTSRISIMHVLLAPLTNDVQLEPLITSIKALLDSGVDKAQYSYYLAMIYAKDQRDELAIRYLVQSVEQGVTSIELLQEQSLFDRLKGTQAYQQIIHHLQRKRERANKYMADDLEVWQLDT